MSYEPTEWKAGDVVTSAKLNKIEQGIKDSGNYVIQNQEELMNMTWQDIFNMEKEGKAIIYKNQDYDANIKTLPYDSNTYKLIISVSGQADTIVFGSTPDSTIADMFNGDVSVTAAYKLSGLQRINGELKDFNGNISINPKMLQQLMKLNYIPMIIRNEGTGHYFSHIRFISNDYTQIITEDGDEYRAETNDGAYILWQDAS